MSAPVSLLGLAGSIRRASHSRAVLATLAERLAPEIAITAFDIASLPHYDADLDGEDKPEPVRRLKDAIAAADGLLIVTPEYNYSIPGVLKNAIDWASRPGYNSVLKGKPVGLIGVSGSFAGGVRALQHLKPVLLATLAQPVPWPDVLIGTVGNKVAAGRLVDETSCRFAADLVAALAAAARQAR